MKKATFLSLFSLIGIFCFGQDQGAAQYQDMMKQMMGAMSNVKTDPVYSFPVYVKYHVINYNNGKEKDEMDVEYYINNASKTFATSGSMMNKSSKQPGENMISVFDQQNHTMLVFNRADKTLFAMNLDAFKNMGKMMGGATTETKKEKADADDFKCGKTGKTKTIMNLSCYEYACSSSNSKSRSALWISDELKVGGAGYLDAIMPLANYNKLGFSGAILGMDAYDDDGQLTTSIEVTDINKSANLKLVTADFERQQMPSFN